MSTVKVMLVDDEDGIRVTLGLLLADMGYAIRTASSGAEALAALRQEACDIIITDMRMPGMDGLEVLTAVRTEWPDAETVMLTGHGDMELAVSSLRLGAADFLTKPVAEPALVVALERACERLRLRKALRQHTQELEALVESRTRELVIAERMAAMGEAAAMLSHTIKNIAGNLEGGLFVLGKGIELDRHDYLEDGWGIVRDNVAEVRDLALRLLDLGKPLTLKPTSVDPDAPLRDVVKLFSRRVMEAGVTMQVQPGAGPEQMLLDAASVRHLLTDLLLNALESYENNAKSGAGENEAAHLEPEAMRRIGMSSRRERLADGREGVRYTVEDGGPGFSKHCGLGMDFFVTAKVTGTGVGLMTVQRIVRESGGKLEIGNSSFGGARVEVLLPASVVLAGERQPAVG